MAGNKTYRKTLSWFAHKTISFGKVVGEKKNSFERNGESGIGSRRAAEGYRAPGGEG